MQAEDSGAAAEDRQVKLAEAQQLNFVLSALGIAAALGFWLGGAVLHLPSAVVLAVLPAVLIWLVQREPQLYAIAKQRGDPRTDLGVAFVVCGTGLLLGNHDIHFAGRQMLLECAGLIGLLCCAGVFSAARQNPRFWSTMLGTFVLAGMYGWGLIAAIDSVPDKSAPAYYQTMVADKYESHGRGTSYHLVLAPWGPIQEPDALTVSDAIYERAVIGGRLCIEAHPGVLYLPWYRIVECDESGQ
ncbi:MAG: hypothetical protein WCC14_11135 [Acidobacteriaceae bacterium]